MHPHPLLNHEIARHRHADMLRQATQARLARAAPLERQPRRLPAAQLTWLLHFRRTRTTAAEPVADA
jgi:hypothetical protein